MPRNCCSSSWSCQAAVVQKREREERRVWGKGVERGTGRGTTVQQRAILDKTNGLHTDFMFVGYQCDELDSRNGHARKRG